MSQDEEKYKEELAKNGVDLPELKEKKEESEEAPKSEAAKEEKSSEEDAKDEHLQEKPEEQRKRSIYDEYKDKKSELKLEKEAREHVEKERDELARKLEEATAAKGDDAKETAKDAIEYAKKVGADPDLVKRIIEDARKGFEQKSDPEIAKRLERFEAWEKTNAKTIEQSMFNDEFEKSIPSLKKLFPTVNDEELKTIKSELDTISHTKEWHDKSLAYVAFEHQDKLSALVSPKKRGMESKGRKEVGDASFDFDPEADYSKMTPAERVQWEKEYKAATKSDGLITDSKGKKLIL